MEAYVVAAYPNMRPIVTRGVQPEWIECAPATNKREISPTQPFHSPQPSPQPARKRRLLEGAGARRRPASVPGKVDDQRASGEDEVSEDTSHSPGLVGFQHVDLKNSCDEGRDVAIHICRDISVAAARHIFSDENYQGFVFHTTCNHTLHVIADYLHKQAHCKK
eukprot:4574192-Amphidinium_carterae.4